MMLCCSPENEAAQTAASSVHKRKELEKTLKISRKQLQS